MKTRILLISLLLLTFTLNGSIDAFESRLIKGQILDQESKPLALATVTLTIQGNIVSQVKSNEDGSFEAYYNSTSITSDQLTLIVTSVGFKRNQTILQPEMFNQLVIIKLQSDLLELKPIKVQPNNDLIKTHLSIDSKKIEQSSRHSLVTTDPISSIRTPQVSRTGSQHSSKLRVHGSNPDYYLNDANIGTDPNHYGMFSIIPAPVVQNINFSAQGTSARFSSPSVIELTTTNKFTPHQNGSFNLSVLEATGNYSFGNSKFFVLSSLRKSVLDKIVKQLDIQSDRRTIPPTNFQDIFLSGGLKLSQNTELILDQYHVRDFLSYNTGSVGSNSNGISTFQNTSEHFFALRLKATNRNSLLRSRLQYRELSERYSATTPVIKGRYPFSATLSQEARELGFNLDYSLFYPNHELALGSEIEFNSYRKIDLEQQGWNFLPPDANSNNAYLYQREMDILYGSFHENKPFQNSALYASFRRTSGNIESETGLRLQSYGELKNKSILLIRQSFGFQIGTKQLQLSAGTYSDSPTGRLLDPYQIIIADQSENLKPIITKLISATLTSGYFKISAFTKQISNLPVISNDFSQYSSDGAVSDGFITVISNGLQNFRGGNISYENNLFLSDRIKLYTFYGFAHTNQRLDNIAVPYELDSPHSFFAQGSYIINKMIKVGASASLRSGYRYTPMRGGYHSVDINRYNESYYRGQLSQENSARFRASASLNIFTDINWNNTSLYLSVMNLTNRSNPIINASDGHIYDAGITPSLGFSYKF